MSQSVPNPEKLLQRLEWTVIRRLDGLFQGDYRTLFRGFGLDLADLREYQVGDDVRAIDWNVTARLQVPHVRQYNEDREVTAWFLLDVSPSVDFGSATVRKRALLTDFVGVVARLLSRHGNRVGAILYGGRVERVIPARAGRRHLLHVLDELQRAPRQPAAQQTDLGELLRTAVRTIKRRSLVFLVSDFFTIPGWGAPLGLLTLRHEALAVRLFDPMELQLPDVGMVFVSDSETGEQMLIDTADRRFRERFAAAAQRHETELRRELTQAGVDALELSTAEDLVASITRYAALRRRRTRSATSATAGGGN